MGNPAQSLDPTDWQILSELQADARLSYAELGRRVGLSSPAVQERVRKLEDAGIIEGYHAKINVEQVGYPIIAFVRVAKSGKEVWHDHLLAIVAEMDEALECYKITGEDCFVIKLVATSVTHLSHLVDCFGSFATTETSLILTTHIKNHIVAPDALLNTKRIK